MSFRFKHIVFSSVSLLLLVAITVPSIVKLIHTIHEHQQEECYEDIATHFHEVELDCDFQKFKLSTQFYQPLHTFDAPLVEVYTKSSSNTYSFLSKYQKLHFVLRGPPAIS